MKGGVRMLLMRFAHAICDIASTMAQAWAWVCLVQVFRDWGVK